MMCVMLLLLMCVRAYRLVGLIAQLVLLSMLARVKVIVLGVLSASTTAGRLCVGSAVVILRPVWRA